MLTPTKSRSHRSPGRTGFIVVLMLALVATVVGLGYLVTRPHSHAQPGPVAVTASPTPTTPSPQQTTPSPTPSGATSPAASSLPTGVVPFVALPVGIPPTPGAGEARYAWHQLKATVQGPTRVSRGSTVSYVVTLRNPGASEVPLAPCPSYDVVIGLRTSSYGLNCAGAASSTIAAGASMSFEVRLSVPQSMGAGPATLTWRLGWQADGGSPHAQLRLQVQ